MKSSLPLLILLATIMLLATPVLAAAALLILGFDVSGGDIAVHLAVNRGIESAARDHGAPFFVTGSLAYPGALIPVAVALKDTTKTGQLDAATVAVSFTITVDHPPAAASDISASLELTPKPGTSNHK